MVTKSGECPDCGYTLPSHAHSCPQRPVNPFALPMVAGLSFQKRETVTIETHFAATITAEQIRQAFGLPKDCRVYFHVPGGGDWSNTDIDIAIKHPLHVERVVIETVDKSKDDSAEP
jgi:hypothetical protein